MEQSPPWEDVSRLAGQELPAFMEPEGSLSCS
jgi:hypothetical protein